MTLSVAEADRVLQSALASKPVSLGSGSLPRQVTVCGGGNGAHVCAGYFGWKGIKVGSDSWWQQRYRDEGRRG